MVAWRQVIQNFADQSEANWIQRFDSGNHASGKDDKAPVTPPGKDPQPKAKTLEELKEEVIGVCKELTDANKKEVTLATIKEISGSQNPLNLKDIKTTKLVLDAINKLK